jgi:hypothetical protein
VKGLYDPAGQLVQPEALAAEKVLEKKKEKKRITFGSIFDSDFINDVIERSCACA